MPTEPQEPDLGCISDYIVPYLAIYLHNTIDTRGCKLQASCLHVYCTSFQRYGPRYLSMDERTRAPPIKEFNLVTVPSWLMRVRSVGLGIGLGRRRWRINYPGEGPTTDRMCSPLV